MYGIGRGSVTAALVLAGALAAGLAAGRIPGLRGAGDQRKALMAVDRDFDEATARDGVEGWVSFFADDGIMMPAGQGLVVGKTAIRRFVEPYMGKPGFMQHWEPMDAEVSGDLGYTYGVFKVTRKGQNGQGESTYGKYVTVWRKQGKTWKVALDIGNASPAPKEK